MTVCMTVLPADNEGCNRRKRNSMAAALPSARCVTRLHRQSFRRKRSFPVVGGLGSLHARGTQCAARMAHLNELHACSRATAKNTCRKLMEDLAVFCSIVRGRAPGRLFLQWPARLPRLGAVKLL